MTDDIDYIVPPNVRHDLRRAPDDRPVALLLRHSVRNAIPEGSVGNDIPITEDGVRIARDLGENIGTRLQSIRSSPLIRCTQTADAIRDTAGVDCEIVDDTMLGDPGAFVDDGELAWQSYQEFGHREVVRNLVAADRSMPGWHHGPSSAVRLARHMLDHSGSEDGLHLFVSHDMYLLVLGALALDGTLEDEHYPLFLDGLFVWQDDHGGLRIRYKERQGTLEEA